MGSREGRWDRPPYFMYLLKGTARYAGLHLAPAEGFRLWPGLLTLFVLILGHCWYSVVTSIRFSRNNSNFENNPKKQKNLKMFKKIQKIQK